jgi:hypothetical protein
MVFESITDSERDSALWRCGRGELGDNRISVRWASLRLTAAQCSDLNGRLSGVSKVAQAGD